MDVLAYYESLSAELNALKDRVRQIIGKAHWQSDGEWKETMLRSVLRRHLPISVGVGRGFVISPEKSSPQIDILIYDASKPVLYRDGDFVLITADAVWGIIEVKTKLARGNLEESVNQLTKSLEFARREQVSARRRAREVADRGAWVAEHSSGVSSGVPINRSIFGGLFAYETTFSAGRSGAVGKYLAEACGREPNRVIDLVSFGESLFTRWWGSDPQGQARYECWHTYEVVRQAPGYFVSNVLQFITASVTSNRMLWFPAEGKEPFRRHTHPANLEYHVVRDALNAAG